MTREVPVPGRHDRSRRPGDDPRRLVALSLGGLVLLGVALVVAARLDIAVSSAAVAGLASALVVLLVVSLRNRRVHTLGREGAAPVLALREAVQAELHRSRSQRRTGATNGSLRQVHDELDRAYGELGAGREGAASERLRAMGRLTEDWAAGSDERAQALALVAHGDLVARVHAKNAATARRRPAARRGDRGLTQAEGFPDVMGLVDAGDEVGAAKAYRAHTGVGLADAQAAVRTAARRRGVPLGDA